MKQNRKYIKFLTILLALLVVFIDVGMKSSYMTYNVYADEDDNDIGGDGSENPADSDNNNPGDNGGGAMPEIPTVQLQVSQVPTQITFGNVHRGDIPTMVPFTVTNVSQVPVDVFCHPYGDGAQVFVVDHPEVTEIQPGQQIKYNVGVLTDNPAGDYVCSMMLDLSLPESYVGVNPEPVPAAVVCTVTIVEDQPSGVDNVYINPSNFNMKKGTSYTFTADVVGHNITDYTVRWSIDGANSPNTVISSDGKLIVDSGETSDHITVFAAANADPGVVNSAYVSLEEGCYSVNVVADPAEGGIVSGGGNITSGSPCEVVAAANSGYTFKGWYYRDSCVSTNKKYYVNSVTANMTLTARFDRDKAQVILDSSNKDYGTVSDGGWVNIGGEFKIQAKAKDGGRFVCWKEDNKEVTKDAEYTLKNITGTRRLTAVFESNKIQIKLASNPANAGKLTGAGTYDYNRDIQIKAEPVTGYKFVGWLCENNYFSTDMETTLYQVKRDYSIVAVFEPVNNVTYNISTKVVGGKGTIFPSGTSPVSAGRDLPIGATPASGYQVKSFVVDGINQGAIPGYMFKNIDRAHTVEVTFEPIPGADVSKKTDKTKTEEAKKKVEEKKKITVTVPDGESLVDTSDDSQSKPEDEPVIPVYNDLAVNDTDSEEVTGILQEYGVTPGQAKELVKQRDQLAFDMFWEAVEKGYFTISIDNEFSDYPQEDAHTVYEDVNSSVHDFIPAMSACTSLDDAVEILSGEHMGYTLSISGYDLGVPDTVKTQLDDAAAQYGNKVAEYMDIFFAKSKGDAVKPITELPRDLEIEIVINIPDSIKGLSDEFAVVRCHKTETGDIENTLLEDLDDNPDTITIKTGKFSSYGIVYPASLEPLTDDSDCGSVKKPLNKPLMISIVVVLVVLMTASVVVPVKAVKNKKRRTHRRHR